jgi:hypothetical protein
MLQNYRLQRNFVPVSGHLRAAGEKARESHGLAASAAEFVNRTIVERHFGKHTGLPRSAKACPRTSEAATGRRAGEEVQTN